MSGDGGTTGAEETRARATPPPSPARAESSVFSGSVTSSTTRSIIAGGAVVVIGGVASQRGGWRAARCAALRAQRNAVAWRRNGTAGARARAEVSRTKKTPCGAAVKR
jgi:hypothetical protein